MIDLDRLRSSFRGTLVLPGDDGYDEARAVWNAAIDRRPAGIVRSRRRGRRPPRRRVRARRATSRIAVRGGGHSFAGKGRATAAS